MEPTRDLNQILVTGGCGFIGSNFIRFLLAQPDFTGTIVNIDKLTYAGNPENLTEVEAEHGDGRYIFRAMDIGDHTSVQAIFAEFPIDTVVHFAAESHVDRSIFGPADFIQTNILGTFTLLETVRRAWRDKSGVLFHHISTDEVYGSLPETGHFFEHTPYDPHSPYSASKAASDHLVKAYAHTYNLPVTLSNCSNNYGPFQFPEKLIPLLIHNALEGKQLPIYGDGKNVRDWLYVVDHCSAIWRILKRGRLAETYNVGGDSEKTNLEVVERVCDLLQTLSPPAENRGITHYHDLITFVPDRPGHDRRYAINFDKIREELGWTPTVSFDEGMQRTIRWYLDHGEWVEHITSGEYRRWIDQNYATRE